MNVTQRLAGDDTSILPSDSRAGVSLIAVLNKSIALVYWAADDFAIFGKDDFNVCLLDHSCVEVADEDSGVEWSWVCLVGHVAGLSFTGHPPQPAGLVKHKYTHTNRNYKVINDSKQNYIF